MVGKIFVDERTLGTKINQDESVTSPTNRVVVLQPSYLPWIGYFEQMARADQFVYLDDVQYTRRDWRNRNKIRTNEGWAWLTVPVQQKKIITRSYSRKRVLIILPIGIKNTALQSDSIIQMPHFLKIITPILILFTKKDGSFCSTYVTRRRDTLKRFLI